MNSKTILAASLAGIFVMSMVMTPVFAAVNAYLIIRDSSTSLNGDGTLNIDIRTKGAVPQNGKFGAFGYGVLTSPLPAGLDNVLVLVTHSGFDDSTPQTSASDPAQHLHVLDLKAPTADCTAIGDFDAEVDFTGSAANGAAFDPDYDFTVKANKISISNIDTTALNDDSVDAIVSFTAAVPALNPDGSPTNICVDVVGLGVGL